MFCFLKKRKTFYLSHLSHRHRADGVTCSETPLNVQAGDRRRLRGLGKPSSAHALRGASLEPLGDPSVWAGSQMRGWRRMGWGSPTQGGGPAPPASHAPAAPRASAQVSARSAPCVPQRPVRPARQRHGAARCRSALICPLGNERKRVHAFGVALTLLKTEL